MIKSFEWTSLCGIGRQPLFFFFTLALCLNWMECFYPDSGDKSVYISEQIRLYELFYGTDLVNPQIAELGSFAHMLDVPSPLFLLLAFPIFRAFLLT